MAAYSWLHADNFALSLAYVLRYTATTCVIESLCLIESTVDEICLTSTDSDNICL